MAARTHHQERVTSARAQARIALEVGAVNPNDPRGALPGDPERLRGLPAIGIRGGLGGAIKGTKPGRPERDELRDRRHVQVRPLLRRWSIDIACGAAGSLHTSFVVK